MISEAQLRVYDSPEDLHKAVASRLVDVIRRAVSDKGICILALSGGETPRPVYRKLGSLPFKEQIEWERVHLLFGDERMVPPGDPRSNFLMVERELISGVPIPPQNVHRIAGEKEPSIAAMEYQAELRGLLSHGQERIDCVLLGLGDDGHTASLLQGSSVLQEKKAWVLPQFSQQTGTWRVTMTLPLINAARNVIFVVSGKRKASIMCRISRSQRPGTDLPALLIQPVDGELIWMIDSGAGSELS